MTAPARHVYVHAPFCARRCVYCDFAVHVSRQGDVDAWQAAVAGEVEAVAGEGLFVLPGTFATVYVGGGTPSLLGPTAMDRLADTLGRDRFAAPELEWTAEANPESLTPEVAAKWAAAGVNRLSLGVQTFSADALRWMGRLHGPEGAAAAVGRARDAGIANLSVDLIFGLPEEVSRDWSLDLERAVTLDVPHVSLYGLTVESGTPLARSVEEGRERPADEERYRDEYLEAVETLTDAGYVHYEVSNFARAGFESRHNTAYWDGSPYLGLGNGAHSYAHPVRRWNAREWSRYAEIASSGALPEDEREEIGEAEARLERFWLGLRTRAGVPVHELNEARRALVSGWIERGWAEQDGATVRLLAEGWLLLDRLAVELEGAGAG